jgi:hypothetical protein
MKTKFVTTLCLPIAALLVLAGCGGGGSKANASTSSTTGSANADRSAFTKCLSDHGVTLPSGGFPGGGNGGPPANGSLPDFGGGNGSGTPPRGSFPGANNPKSQEAFNACRSQLPNSGQGGFAGANSQAFQAYTSCLRDHGVSVPTTTAGGSATPGSRPNFQSDPKFASANKTCRSLLPTNNNTSTTTSGS